MGGMEEEERDLTLYQGRDMMEGVLRGVLKGVIRVEVRW